MFDQHKVNMRIEGLTVRTGYVIHSAIIFTDSLVKRVDIAFVANTVKPPASRLAIYCAMHIHDTPPNIAHRPISITTTRLPNPPSLRPPRMIADTKYTREKITKGRWVIAPMRASGVSTGAEPSDDGEESTTVVAPMTASRIPITSRCVYSLLSPASDCGSSAYRTETFVQKQRCEKTICNESKLE